MFLKPYVKGLATYIPGFYPHLLNLIRPGRTGGTISARYCYSVWMRHLVMAHRSGRSTRPRVVAELGPGDSLGIGLAALLSGADTYYAFDVVAYASNRRNLEILDELVELYRARAPIPDAEEFPEIVPRLESYAFPDEILTPGRLQETLHPGRLEAVRQALLGRSGADYGIGISYCVPWDDAGVIQPQSVDQVFSQAVMEHVDDIGRTYGALRRWLKPDGFMSHVIDYRSHGTAADWNGHWAYSGLEWKLVRGRRPYLLNRKTHSAHLEVLRRTGFDILLEVKVPAASRLALPDLAKPYRNIPAEDLTTSLAFIQAVPA